MLKRIHIKGYKSLRDVEIELPRLAVLFGPNASGKSNFLDALQLLSRLATSRTLREAFAPPYRGKPLESFSFGHDGLRGLLDRKRLHLSIEADIELSEAVVDAVNREIQQMDGTAPRPAGSDADREETPRTNVRHRHLRYRIDIEMAPRCGSRPTNTAGGSRHSGPAYRALAAARRRRIQGRVRSRLPSPGPEMRSRSVQTNEETEA